MQKYSAWTIIKKTTIVELYNYYSTTCSYYELWVNEWFNSLLIVIILIIFWYKLIANFIWSVFYFYSNWSRRLLWILVFPSILIFCENIQEVKEINRRVEGWFWKMSLREIASQCVEIFALISAARLQMWFVQWPLVLYLCFQNLESIRELYPLINY